MNKKNSIKITEVEILFFLDDENDVAHGKQLSENNQSIFGDVGSFLIRK